MVIGGVDRVVNGFCRRLILCPSTNEQTKNNLNKGYKLILIFKKEPLWYASIV